MATSPTLTHLADAVITVGEPIVIGETADGLRRVIPITGGRIVGPRLSGTILAAGADFQLIRPDGYTTLEARYTARLTDGAMLYIVNAGIRFGPPDVMARITRGEVVDPALVYFRTTPRFEIADPTWTWLTRPLFLGSGARYPDRVEMRFFEVD